VKRDDKRGRKQVRIGSESGLVDVRDTIKGARQECDRRNPAAACRTFIFCSTKMFDLL
jgi:hypothetical protein